MNRTLWSVSSWLAVHCNSDDETERKTEPEEHLLVYVLDFYI